MWFKPSDVAPRLREHAHEPGGHLAEGALPRPAPAVPGDILVRTHVDGPNRLYTLSTVPGPDQLRCASLAEASRTAREYASLGRVDVWSEDGTGQVTRLSRFRTAELAHAAIAPTTCAADRPPI
jgi:hypothetical protein